MKMKLIAALIAFFATFGASTAFISYVFDQQFLPVIKQADLDTQRRVLIFLEQDIKNGRRISTVNVKALRFSKSYLNSYAQSVNEYVDKSESMNDRDLPGDVQIAWNKHMKAWRAHADFLDEINNLAEMSEIDAKTFNQTFYEQNREIELTWYEVLNVAGDYGAFPRNAY